MKKQVKRLLCMAMAAMMVLAVGCGSSTPQSSSAAPSSGESSQAASGDTDVVKFGVVEPLSG